MNTSKTHFVGIRLTHDCVWYEVEVVLGITVAGI